MLGMNISSDSRSEGISLFKRYTHRIHVWYIYLHLVDFYGFHVPASSQGCVLSAFK